MARPPAIETETAIWLALDMSSLRLSDDQLLRLFRDNDDFRFELSASGELIIMAPTNPDTGRKNSKINFRLAAWTEQDGTGECFDSSSMFTLPNGAKRSPDGAWIPKSRWNRFSQEEKSAITKVCPDFVVELRSPSDRLPYLEAKMEEYIANGTRLAWLLDLIENRATIYRPSQSPERIDNPTILSGDPVLPGFRFDFREIL